MLSGPQVLVRSLVFIGGGHAHVHALKVIGMKPIPGVQVTLITRDVDTPYSGMLPGHIAGHYSKEACHIDLRKMARFAGVVLVHTEAVGLDTDKRLVHCKDGRPPIPYDVLSIDIGSTPKFVEALNPMDLKFVTRVKPIDSFSARWDSIVERVLAAAPQNHSTPSLPSNGSPSNASSSRAAKVVVVGGGAGGVELALAMQYRLKHLFRESGRDPDTVVVEIVNRGKVVLSSHNRRVQKVLKRVLAERKVEVHTGKEVVDVRDPPEGVAGGVGTLVCSDGTEISFSEAIWCTNSGAAKWLRETELALTDQGFIEVNDFLESTNTPGVFAVGDCAHMVNHPRPKAGVFAVRQGPPLAENLRRILEGRAMNSFKPQKAFLGLISTGDENAVLSWRGLAWESTKLWTFKDYIDVKWMRKYKELPLMDTPPGGSTASSSSSLPPPPPRAVAAAGPAAVEAVRNASMRCGGCGSKVGAGVLGRVLSRLNVAGGGGNDDYGGGLDDAAVVAPPSEPGAVMVHTVDFFRSFISDPFVFGQIAANHALSDVHAMGAEPTTALAIATIPFGGETQVESTLEQLLAGALKTLNEAGCLLVGGHTCEGAELALGLSVNGVARGGGSSLLGKGGAAAGDALVLTKAVGTGAILAAEMRGRATSPWLQQAIRSMLQSNGPAAGLLRDHGARACTDVTGFGVAGHLAEMLRAPPLQDRPLSTSPKTTTATVENGGGERGEGAASKEGASPPEAIRPSAAATGATAAAAAAVPQASLNAELDLALLPVLSGAVEVVDAGIVSTLQGQNEGDSAASVVTPAVSVAGSGAGKDARKSACFRLLFDPQTAGGLLASLPRDRAAACVSALKQAGYGSAALIGTVTEATEEGGGGRIVVAAELPDRSSSS
eukprot:g14058.t1